MCGVYLFFLLIGVLKLCSGYEVACTVSGDDQGILYRVPEFEATDCYFNWSNITHHVLANQRGKLEELVLMTTNQTLLLKKCQELIYYSRNCISEGGPRRGTCNASCLSNDDIDKQGNLSHKANWFMISIILTVVLLLGVLTSCIIFRDRIFRNPSCFYATVKTTETSEKRRSMDFGFTFSTVDEVDSVCLSISPAVREDNPRL